MNTDQKTLTTEERNERALTFARRLLQSKRQTQQEMIEEAKNDPRKKAIIDELHRRNAKRGTPIAEV